MSKFAASRQQKRSSEGCKSSHGNAEWPSDYPLAGKGHHNFSELQDWLLRHAGGLKWRGKLYVAKSIEWNGKEFRQGGCSPNYQAGWWTLACCKHDMRGSASFREIADSDTPIFVFTLARKCPLFGGQPLVSVAKVSKYFRTMKEYADFLLKTQDERLISSRFTGHRRNDGQLGWRFGDCHANLNGKKWKPIIGHVHREDKKDATWEGDCQGDHLILLSKHTDFLLWGKPTFVGKHTVRTKNIDDLDILEDFLLPCRKYI